MPATAKHRTDHPLSPAIRYATGECSLGTVLVAASERGIRAISLGDSPAALVHQLRQRFPDAICEDGIDGLARRVAAFVDGTNLSLEAPLDVRGTVFQRQVWQVLRDIPPGSTASYAEVAARIGAPASARAVAGACAANPLAVAIPCHRVVRADGTLSGYRWGAARKRALLRREADA